jgi:hypothetical protein
MPKCTASREDGCRCGTWALPDSEFCRHHGRFSGRHWELCGLCLEEQDGTHFLSARYLTAAEPAAEKVLPILGDIPALEDRRLTTFLLNALLPINQQCHVYGRGPELAQQLRKWLGRLLVTVEDGQQVLGAEVAERLQPGPPHWDVPAQTVVAGAEPMPPVPSSGRRLLSYEVLPFDSSRISMQAVQALSRGKEMKAYEEQRQRYQGQNAKWSPPYWKALAFDTVPTKVRGDWLRGMIGFADDPGEAVWETLVERGALAVQAHFVLWARALQQQGPEPNDWITLTTNDFCDDLGFSRLPGERGHHPERRREAHRVFKLLTKIELHALYFNKKQKPARMLNGGIWVAGLYEQRQIAEAPEPELWVPAWFRYQPGDWFHDKQWREWNRHVGIISRGFLGLNAGNRDKWAVLVGGYLGSRAPVNDYAPLTVKVETICEATGMAAVYVPNHKTAEMLDKLERSLDRLEAVGVLAGSEFLNERTRIRVFWPEVLKKQTEGISDQLERLTRRQRHLKS